VRRPRPRPGKIAIRGHCIAGKMTTDVYSTALKLSGVGRTRRTAAASDPPLDAAVNSQAMALTVPAGLLEAEEQRAS
jgi:hypothetical protein